MSAAQAPRGIQGAMPAMTLHALGLAIGQLDEHTAQVVLHNPVMHAEAKLNKEAARALGERLLALADVLTEAPEATPQLVLPEGAGGGLVVPRG